jgi:hypothetical protein
MAPTTLAVTIKKTQLEIAKKYGNSKWKNLLAVKDANRINHNPVIKKKLSRNITAKMLRINLDIISLTLFVSILRDSCWEIMWRFGRLILRIAPI